MLYHIREIILRICENNFFSEKHYLVLICIKINADLSLHFAEILFTLNGCILR